MKFAQARFVGSFPVYSQVPKLNLPEIAIGGRSNVGKSSLINSLLNRKKLAQISKTPGKTRMLNYFVVQNDAGKEAFHFVDLPGYGYARVPTGERRSWKTLVEGYIENSARLRGFILLVDCRRGLQDDEIEFIEYLLLHKVKTLPAMTKADKLSRVEANNALREAACKVKLLGSSIHYPILHSSVKKTGNEMIWRWVTERIDDES